MPNFQSKTFFVVIGIKSAVKCLIFRRRPFIYLFLVNAIQSAVKSKFSGGDLCFWSFGMVVARWNLAVHGMALGTKRLPTAVLMPGCMSMAALNLGYT